MKGLEEKDEDLDRLLYWYVMETCWIGCRRRASNSDKREVIDLRTTWEEGAREAV